MRLMERYGYIHIVCHEGIHTLADCIQRSAGDPGMEIDHDILVCAVLNYLCPFHTHLQIQG